MIFAMLVRRRVMSDSTLEFSTVGFGFNYIKTSNRELSNGGTYNWYGTISLVPTRSIDLSKIPVTEQFFIRNKKSGPEPVPYLEFLLYMYMLYMYMHIVHENSQIT